MRNILTGYQNRVKLGGLFMNTNTVTSEQIDKIVEATEFKTQTVYGKTTIVSAKLPNGFVITESSACVDPANYDEAIGEKICKDRIKNELFLRVFVCHVLLPHISHQNLIGPSKQTVSSAVRSS